MLRARTRLLCVTQPGRLPAPQPCSLPGPLQPPECLDRQRQEIKQEKVRTPSTAACPACVWHPPAQHCWGLPPCWGDLVPLPRLPPAMSPWLCVLVTALSEHGTGKGAGGVPVGPALPHTCQVTEPQLVTHGCSLPTPVSGAGTCHSHSPGLHAGLSAQEALIPPRKGQPAPQGERRDTHPAEREPRRRQESPEGESPGAEPPWRRRARPALTSGGDGGLRRPQGSPAQLGPTGGELLWREKGKGGKSHCVPQCYSPCTHEMPLT